MNDYNPEEEYEFVTQDPSANEKQNDPQKNIEKEASSPFQDSQSQDSQSQDSQSQGSQGQDLQSKEPNFDQMQSEQHQYEQIQSEQVQYEQPGFSQASQQMPMYAEPVQTMPINQSQAQNAPYYSYASQMQASQMQAPQMQASQAQAPQAQAPQMQASQAQAPQAQAPQAQTFQSYNPQYPPQINSGYPQNLVWQQARPVEQNAPGAYVQPNLQGNPYQGAAFQPQAQKQKTSAGTKVFIGILCGLLVVMVAVFAVSMSKLLSKPNVPFDKSATNETENNREDEYPFFDFFDNGSSYSGSEFEQDLTLQADDGSTAKRSTDKEESVGDPDKNAKDLESNALPKDKSSDKYDTQSVYEKVAQSTVGIVCYKDKITDDKSDILAQGTGTIVSKDGYIITNAHVIGNSKSFVINIILNNSKEYQAKVVGYDTWTDLAVLKIEADNLTAVEFGDSSLIKVGQDVLAIGNPGGTSFQNTLTKGIISATDREIIINKNVKYIQIDAAINPGNSGGPLCNIYGQVIGINSAKISSSLYEGMGFAIPSQTVIDITNDLIHYGYIKDRVRIGITGIATTEEEIYYQGYPKGIIIQEVDPNGPLANSKLKEGDIITKIDGIEVTSFQDIYAILSEHKVGDKVTLTVSRPK